MNWTEEQFAAHQARLKLPAIAAETPVDRPLRIPKPRMNKWEAAYDAELRVKWAAGVIQWYAFEPFKLRLADNTYYTPDFAVIDGGKLEFHEVKGFWREDALVKFKVAAEKFPFLFCAWRKLRVSEGGGWELIRYIKGGAAE